jgi:hypothetical protein
MSRTEEDIAGRVDIPIMGDTTLSTNPASYSEFCDTFRPRLACARRTDSGRERFIDFLVPSPVRDRFVAEHASEGRPACIEDGLRQAGLGESGGIHIADRDVVELSNDADRELMVKVPARVADARVQIRCLTLLTRPLDGREFVSQPLQQPWVLDFAAPAQERSVLLPAGFGVLFAHGIDGAGVQGKFLAAACGQAIQVKAARPTLIPFQRLELSVVAEIPDEVAGSRLAVEQSGQRLDAVAIDQQHRGKLYRLRDLGKAPKLTETSIFEAVKPKHQDRHFLPGASAGVSVPENR